MPLAEGVAACAFPRGRVPGSLVNPGAAVRARQTEPDDRIVRHQLGHLLELGDPITLSHGQLPWIRAAGTSTRLIP